MRMQLGAHGAALSFLMAWKRFEYGPYKYGPNDGEAHAPSTSQLRRRTDEACRSGKISGPRLSVFGARRHSVDERRWPRLERSGALRVAS